MSASGTPDSSSAVPESAPAVPEPSQAVLEPTAVVSETSDMEDISSTLEAALVSPTDSTPVISGSTVDPIAQDTTEPALVSSTVGASTTTEATVNRMVRDAAELGITIPDEILPYIEVAGDETHLTAKQRKDNIVSRLMEAWRKKSVDDHAKMVNDRLEELTKSEDEDDGPGASGESEIENQSIKYDKNMLDDFIAELYEERAQWEAHKRARLSQQNEEEDEEVFSEDEDDDDDNDSTYEGDEEDEDEDSVAISDPLPGTRKRACTTAGKAKKRPKLSKPASSKSKKAIKALHLKALTLGNVVGSDVFGDAASTAHLGDQPGMQANRQRRNAIKSLLASLPMDERSAARSDTDRLEDAISEIGARSLQSSHDGGWLLKGMKTSLKHYQVFALAFMRRQESKLGRPHGGILADGMGLGKTVEALSNIVRGEAVRAKHNSMLRKGEIKDDGRGPIPRPTLIVVPSGLLAQWSAEIERHVHVHPSQVRGGRQQLRPHERHGLFGVVNFRDVKSMKGQALKTLLEKQDVVLVSYHAVLASWPRAPEDLTKNAQKKAWYRKHRKSKAGVLHQINWQRVILDEAHQIKNHLSSTSLACRALKTRFAWALTGTPVQNSLTEFYPYFRLIKDPVIQSYRSFCNNYAKPEDPACVARLLALLTTSLLRRTNADTMFGRKLLKIPQAEQAETMMLTMTPTEKIIYNMIKAHYRTRFNKMVQTKSGLNAYSTLQTMTLRLRQATGHFILLQDVIAKLLDRAALERLKDDVSKQESRENAEEIMLQLHLMVRQSSTKDHKTSKDSKGTNATIANLYQPTDRLADLKQAAPEATQKLGKVHGIGSINYSKYFEEFTKGEGFIQTAEQTICVACHGMPANAHITSCDHVYCYDCLENLLQRGVQLGRTETHCIECGEAISSAKKCFEPDLPVKSEVSTQETSTPPNNGKGEPSRRALRRWLDLPGPMAPSTKTAAMKTIVLKWLEDDPTVKIIIYSQFVSLLIILERVCRVEHWTAQRYDGGMSLGKRDAVLKRFCDPKGGVQILLASLKCGALGLNLTAASKVLLMDAWWNSSVEEQAFCRVYRHGQTQATQLVRLVVRDTIDERMTEIKARKSDAINPVLERDDSRANLTVDELISLFGQAGKDDQGNTFIMPDDDEAEDDFICFEDDPDDDSESMED